MNRQALMQSFVDERWDACVADGSSWIGFYVVDEAEREMVLGACRDTPACSPIGLHGMCGRAWRTRRRLIIPDVHAHGAGHIVCDPRNLSEFVIPLFDESGVCWGVFDADSHRPDCYGAAQVERVTRDLVAAGLTTTMSLEAPVEVLSARDDQSQHT